MAASARYLIKQKPTDVWSVRERLALASSVLRSGDQNWVSVSRAIKPFAEPNRPPDWFSQKNCALQYSALLEKAETPKRKRSERGESETPGTQIVRKLTIEHIEELKTKVQEEQQRYKKLKREIEIIKSGQCDDKLTEIWDDMLEKKKKQEMAEEAAAKKLAEETEARALAAQSRAAGKQFNKPGVAKSPGLKLTIPRVSDAEDSAQDSASENQEVKVENLDSPAGVVASQSEASTISDNMMDSGLGSGEQLKSETVTVKEEPIDALSVVHEESVQTTEEVEVKTESDTSAAEDSSSSLTPVHTTNKPVTPVSAGAPTLSRLLVASPISSPTLTNQSTPLAVSQNSSSSNLSTMSNKSPTAKPGPRDTPVAKNISSRSNSEKEKESEKAGNSRPVSITLEDDAPQSPASSVVSNETDSGSVRSKGGRSSRGTNRGRTSRRSSARITRKTQDDERINKPSEGDTSDDDNDQVSFLAKSINMESLPNSPASICPSDTEDEKAHKNWKKSIMLVWRAAANHKYANVFLHPVTEEIAPGYTGIVHRPMDLSTIKRQVENGTIRSTEEFQRDCMLMFTNAIMYNNSNQDIYSMAGEMYTDVLNHIEQYVNTQIMVNSDSLKTLRQSRRSEAAMSDKEEDGRKRKTEPEAGGKSKKRRN